MSCSSALALLPLTRAATIDVDKSIDCLVVLSLAQGWEKLTPFFFFVFFLFPFFFFLRRLRGLTMARWVIDGMGHRTAKILN